MRIENVGDATLYLGDCLEILPTLGKIDAVVTDPPYGMGLDTDFSKMVGKFKNTGGTTYDSVVGDDKPFDPKPLLACSKAFVLFGADYYMKRLPDGGSLTVWDKRLTESADKMFGSCFELIWIYPPKKRHILRHKWAGVFGSEREDCKRVHPTQKPLEVMQWCVDVVNGTVLDPFMGSGTTGVACANLGREFIGIEIEEKYFDIACRRIEDAYKQPRLFKDEPEPKPTQVELEAM